MKFLDPDPGAALAVGAKKQKIGRRDRTRSSLVATALRLINDRGIEATSVLAITEAAGISNGAFYYHFDSKDSLLEEVGLVLVARLVEQIEGDVRPDPAGQVARGPLIILRYIVGHPELHAVLLRVVDDANRAHVHLSARLRQAVERGAAIGRFHVRDVDLAVEFCRAIMARAVRDQPVSNDVDQLAMLTSLHTLTMLGLPAWEAHTIVEAEMARIGEFAMSGQRVSVGNAVSNSASC